MNIALIITCVIAVALLILVIASKVLNVLIGLLATIGGIVAYFWLGSTDAWMNQIKVAIEFGVKPEELRTYSLILIGVGVVLLIIGVLRGRKRKEKVVVQQQAPKVKNDKEKTEKKEEIKPETKKEEVKPEAKKEEVKPEAKKEKAKTQAKKEEKIKKETDSKSEKEVKEEAKKEKTDESKAE